jgi:hypothetical protein
MVAIEDDELNTIKEPTAEDTIFIPEPGREDDD